METTDVKELVRVRYGSIAAGEISDCRAPVASCCGAAPAQVADRKSRLMGYSAEELAAAPISARAAAIRRRSRR